MPLAKLSDFEHLKQRAWRAGVKLAFNTDWPRDRILATLLEEAEKLGFDPLDPHLIFILRLQVNQGERYAPRPPEDQKIVSQILDGKPWSEVVQDINEAMRLADEATKHANELNLEIDAIIGNSMPEKPKENFNDYYIIPR